MSSTATLVRFIALALFTLITLPLQAQVERHEHNDGHGHGGRHGHRHELQPAPKFNSKAELSFTENRGQIIDTRGEARPDILYRSESQGMHLYFRKDAISYVFVRFEGDMLEYSRRQEVDHTGDIGPAPTIHYYRTDMELVGANPNVQVIAEDTTEDILNYYLGYLPSSDIRGVRSFRRLIYRDIYPNIDMVVNGGVNGMKCDFVVRPGGNPYDIKMRYLAADKVSILNGSIPTEGALRVTTPEGTLEMEAPYTYQHDLALARQTVPSRYTIRDGVIGFEVGMYDRSMPLVIDPFLLWSTFFGGTAAEDMAGGDPSEVDRNGNVLITGNTASTAAQQFPLLAASQATHGGQTDCFIAKYSSSGTRLWSTYWGGTRDEMGHGIATDISGNVFVTGHTIGGTPNNLPTVNPFQAGYGSGQRDAIVAKFDPNGIVIWATYLGGANWDDGYGFAVDSTGNVCVAITTGSNFTTPLNGGKPNPAGNGDAQYDVLLVKFNAVGAFVWSYYFGGGAMEYVYGATSDIRDNIIITGWTQSNGTLPMQNAAQPLFGGATDAFVAKFSSNGTLKWSTYYGGAGTENYVGFGAGIPGGPGYSAITSDPIGNTFVTGYTTGNFPTFGGVFQPGFQGGVNDGFIIKFDTNGVREWASYVGGAGRDIGVGVASNSQGGCLISGFTNSNAGFPITFPPGAQAAFQAGFQGNPWDGFIVKLKKDGAQTWGTYFGGPNDDQGQGISFDPYGSLVVTGVTTSGAGVPPAGFPVLAGDQMFNRGNTDAFVSMFCDPDPPRIDSTGSLTFCNPDSVKLSVIAGYTEVRWFKLGTPDVLITTQDTITIKETGRWYVRVKNAGGCTSYSDTLQTTKLDRINPSIQPGPTANICTGDTLTLSVNPGPFVTHTWTNQSGATVGTAATYKATAGGTYKVVVVNARGCRDSATVTISEYPKPADVSVTPADTIVLCEGDSRALTATGGAGGTIVWSNGGVGTTLNVSTAGAYFARAVGPSGCEKVSNRVIVKVNKKPVPKILPLLPVSFCEGDSTVLAAVQTPGGPLTPYRSYLWMPGGQTTDKISATTSGDYTVTVTDTNGCQASATITVTANEKPDPKLVISPDSVICEGDSVTISVNQSFAGYRWSTGSTDNRIKVGRSGSYFVTVSNFGGCEGVSDTVNIRVVPSPIATVSGALSVCTNTPASYSVPAGTGLSYAWKLEGPSGTITSASNTPSIDVGWGGAGNNRVIVTVTDDATGCKSSDTVNVEVGSVLVPNITYIGSTRLCPGDSIVLDAGPGYSKYTWAPGGEISRTITVKTAGTYRVSVENSGGCSGTSNPVDITIGTPPSPSITIEGGKSSLCPGDTVWLDAGAGYREYAWSNGFTNRRIPVWRTDSLTVTVTDTSGCTGVSQQVKITMNTPPAPVVTGPNSVCINSTDDYEVTGDPGDTYQWQVLRGNGTITAGSGTSKITVRWTVAGTDTLELVQISAATGCRGTTRYVVEVGTTLNPQITSNRVGSFCDGDSVTLSAPAGYSTYLWDNGRTEQSIVVKTAGTYRVTVTDDGGCSGSGEITVTQKARLDPRIVPDGMPGLCPGDSLKLEATPGFRTYRWAPTGDTTRIIWVKSAGSYTVTVTDLDSCVGVSAAVDVTIFPQLAQPKILTSGDTLIALIDVVDSPQPASYQWFLNGAAIGGATDQRHKYSVVGSYTVTVVDSNGCSSTSEPFTPTSFAFASVQVPVISAVPGQRVKIPVMLDSSENLDRNNVHNFEAKLRFNGSMLIPADGRPSVIVGHDRVVTITGSRQATVASGELVSLEFIAALGDTIETPLILETFRFSDTANGLVPVTIVNGVFRLEGLCENGGTRLIDVFGAVRLKEARPNPTGNRAQIEYEVVENGPTELFVVDMLGNRVATLVEGDIVAGSYMVELDASRLESGTYIYILQTPTDRLARILQVVK